MIYYNNNSIFFIIVPNVSEMRNVFGYVTKGNTGAYLVINARETNLDHRIYDFISGV